MKLQPPWRAVAVVAFYVLLFSSFFAPVLFTGALLAPGDGVLLYLPAFRSRALWDTAIGAGFPLAADGASQPFYPLAVVASRLDAWNALVISAYVIAAAGTCGFVFELTGSLLGSLLAGIVFGSSAFLIIHLPHLNQIHATAWVPLALWAFERLRRTPSRAWFLVAAAAVASSVLATHPQPFVNGFTLAGAYAVVMGFRAPVGRRRYWTSIAAAACLGLGVAAVQWIPMLELARLSHRPHLSFAEFVSHSLPARQAAQLFFPFLFGGASETGPFAPAYYGKWNLGELAGYVGFIPWSAAIVAVLRHEDRRQVWFWATAAVLSFALALGPDTPLASIVYRIPPYNRLRCPARHLFETTMSIAVLSGLGIAALRRGRGNGALAARVSLSVLVAAAVALAVSVFGFRRHPVAAAWQVMAETLGRPAVFVPLTFAALAVPAIVFFARKPASLARTTALVALVVLDLASFGWFVDWRIGAPRPEHLSEPAWLPPYAARLRAENQRLATFHPSTVEAAVPNIAWLWGVPNATVYPALTVGRHHELLPLGGVSAFCTHDRALDLLAVRYAPRPRVRRFGFEWESVADPGCGDGSGSRVWTLPDVLATRIGIVAALGDSVNVPDGAQVGVLEVETADGVLSLPIRAGEHVSEWAYERPDVRSRIRHRRARIFDSVAVVDADGRRLLLHRSVADLDLGGLRRVRRLEVRSEPSVVLRVDNVSTTDGRDSQPVAEGLVDPERWRLAGVSDAVRIYENLRAMPRAWLATEALKLARPEILRAVHTSRLPDGREFDPYTTALVEDEIALAGGPDGAAAVDEIRIEDESLELRTRAPGERLLVLSDVYYPGWQATVDGAATRVHPVDYALRGLRVPAGEHRVRLEFRPVSLRIGAAISLASLLLLGGLVVFLPSVSLKRGEER